VIFAAQIIQRQYQRYTSLEKCGTSAVNENALPVALNEAEHFGVLGNALRLASRVTRRMTRS
jgi:hypothetical protein